MNEPLQDDQRIRTFLDEIGAAIERATDGGLRMDDLSGVMACYTYATLQLVFDLDQGALADMVAMTLRRYFTSGAFERNREVTAAAHRSIGTMQ